MTNAVLEVSMTSFANLMKGQLVRPQLMFWGGNTPEEMIFVQDINTCIEDSQVEFRGQGIWI